MAANQAKKDAVAELVIKLKAAKTVVLADYRGLSAVEADELRKITREAGVEYFVAKNRLFKLALEEVGYESDFGTDLKGTTAFALSSDAVAPAKAIFDFGMAKKGKLAIKAGLLYLILLNNSYNPNSLPTSDGSTLIPGPIVKEIATVLR